MGGRNDMTRAWEYYERGRDYNNRLSPNLYRLVDTNLEFFSGNQWINMPDTPAMNRLPKPVFNIIKRITSLFVASLTSSAVSISFEPLSWREGDEYARFASAEVANLLEKFKMDYRVREALFDGAQTGDYCAHFYWDPDALPYGGSFGAYRGEIRMELVDGVNVMFGNPNTADVESQPYILIVGRNTVENLRREAREKNGVTADSEFGFQAGQGGRIELASAGDEDGKALYCYLYTKKRVDGRETVHVTKATRDCVIFEDRDTGLSRYPIAWGNWEKQKNQYHGRALVTGIIPNQIFINTMFAMVMRHLQLSGFPKTVYNADLISSWSNEVGQAIGVHGVTPGQSIGQVAANLAPADMSSQIIAAIDKAMAYTKECLGATDAQLGDVRPENTSALMVLQSSAEVPLENTRAGLYEWVEDIGAILLDMMGTYYGRRPVVREREIRMPAVDALGGAVLDPATGLLSVETQKRRVVEMFDFSVFKDLWLRVRADVGASTYFSEIAMVQTLDNLRRDGTLSLIEYLERVPDKLIPRKAELIEALRERGEAGEQPDGKGAGISESGALAKLSTTVQAKYSSLPGVAQKALMAKAQL
ncbi:MAG: hypothetical protein PUB32_04615 [Clostridiales bacterium]|nr:hypothetical protein [Clostridiales bacterium]